MMLNFTKRQVKGGARMREWLRDARSRAGLTMKQMADNLHISESYYCSIENGYRQKNMDISLAEGISRVLKLPIKHILKFEADSRHENDTAQPVP